MSFLEKLIEFLLSKEVITTGITIVVSIIVIKILTAGVTRVIKGSNASSIAAKRRNTIVNLFTNIIRYLIIILAVIVILAAWGVNVSGIITSLGVAGVVAGLALQDALKDIIAGCNIIMDDYFVVGNLVEINDFTGYVIEFGLKRTKIKGFNGTVLVIANREITSIKNLSIKSSNLYVTISVAYEEPNEKVEKVIMDLCKEIDKDKLVIKPTEYLGINKLSDSSVDYYICAHCKGDDQYALNRTINKLVKITFDKEKITIPYNQIEVHNGK